MRFIKITIYLVAFTLLSSWNLLARPQNSVIYGNVVDKNGDKIPGAIVKLVNKRTKSQQIMTSNEKGEFQFIRVPSGIYVLSIKSDGYKIVKEEIEIAAASRKRYDMTLQANTIAMSSKPALPSSRESNREREEREAKAEVIPEVIWGAIAETMEVKGNSDYLRSLFIETAIICCDQGAARGTAITREQVVSLPIITRNIYELIALAPGTIPTSEGSGMGIASNGQRSSSGNYVLDGGDYNDAFTGSPLQTIPLDSIQEFRVLTNQYAAVYGRNAGFIANVISSQGTNDFHLSAFDFNRNSALAAHTFDENAKGLPKADFNRNQFGGTIGGPIKRDKAFFFFSAEPTRVRSIGTERFFVPTDNLLQISSGATRTALTSLFNRFPIPSNSITSEKLILPLIPFGSDTVQNVPAYIAVTRTGPANAGAGDPADLFLATGRVDYGITDKLQLFGRYSISNNDIFPQVSQPYDKSLDQGRTAKSQSILLNLTRIWSANLVSESRITYNRRTDESPATAKTGSNYLPSITIKGGNLGISLPSGTDSSGGAQNNYQVYSETSWNKGDHLFNFGGQYIHIRDNRIVPGASQLTTISFANTQALVNGIASYTLRFDPQGRILGQNVNQPLSPPIINRHFRYNDFAFFAQDTWKVNSRVTLTAGLRWEYFGVPHSIGSEKTLDANFYYGDGATVFDRIANGKFLSTGDAPGKYKDHFYLPDYNNFAPRLGIAWDVFNDSRTVFRAGTGIFYDRNSGNVLEAVGRNFSAYAEQTLTLPFSVAALTDPYAFLGSTPLTLNNISGRQLDQNLKTAYSVSWNAGIEQVLRSYLLVGITYVGTSGNKLYSINDINRVNSGTLLGRPASFDVTRNENRLITGVRELNTLSNLGHSTYHSLQLRVETGYIKSLGLQVGANYTFSHSIDNSSSVFRNDLIANPLSLGFVDAFNPGLDKGDSDFDVRHRFVANFVWDLPFGVKSKKWFIRNVLAGWGISGIFSFQSGQPFSIYDSGNPDFLVSENPRPKFSGTLPKTTLTPIAGAPNTYLYLPLNHPFRDAKNNCISTGPFYCSATRGESYDGTISRNIFRRPGTQYHNLAVSRNFALPKIFRREGVKLQLRGEFYNVFNHANLYIESFSNDIGSESFNSPGTNGICGCSLKI